MMEEERKEKTEILQEQQKDYRQMQVAVARKARAEVYLRSAGIYLIIGAVIVVSYFVFYNQIVYCEGETIASKCSPFGNAVFFLIGGLFLDNVLSAIAASFGFWPKTTFQGITDPEVRKRCTRGKVILGCFLFNIVASIMLIFIMPAAISATTP